MATCITCHERTSAQHGMHVSTNNGLGSQWQQGMPCKATCKAHLPQAGRTS
jgi:hypothetical protein